MSIGSLAFLNPWILAALAALPILWWLLKATPPAPLRERFPGVAILLGLEPPEKTPHRTPWWLLLLRILAVALLIFAFAQPILDPRPKMASGEGPVILALDDGWASAPDWEARRDAAREILAQASRAERSVALISLADPPLLEGERLAIAPRSAAEALGLLEEMAPKPWPPRRGVFLTADFPPDSDLVWIHDGLDGPGAGAFVDSLQGVRARAIGPVATARGLRAEPPGEEPGRLLLTALRAEEGAPEALRILAWEAPQNAAPRVVASALAEFGSGAMAAETEIEAPLDLLNRVAYLTFENGRSAGGTALLDERFRRKRVAVVSGERVREDQPLLSGGHFLREALAPLAEIQNADLLAFAGGGGGLAAFDAVILVDVGAFAPSEAAALEDWVQKGGTLIRFGGPATLAAADDLDGFKAPDPLLPARLRPGRRDLGGAMSWGEPQGVAPFDDTSPFFGLTPPSDVLVSRQILAEPDVDLPPKIWARLADGSPLVTAERRGAGSVVFFHVSAEPTWSSLPLSGLFMEMLGRILDRAAAFGPHQAQGLAASEAAALWTPSVLLDAHGAPHAAETGARPVTGARLAESRVAADAPPGVYLRDGGQIALNVVAPDMLLLPLPAFPANVAQEPLGGAPERPLKPLLLSLALLILAADAIGTLFVTGRLRSATRAAGMGLLAAGLALGLGAGEARAQETLPKAEEAALAGSFGYVLTGDPQLDELSRAGLYGLSQQLAARTAIEPGQPEGVDVERDELSVYPFLYWPISPLQSAPSSEAVAKLNAYLRQGGMIVFDTRDAHLAMGGAPTPGAEALRRIASGLDLPPLAPLNESHVLARSFFILKDFPGRWSSGDVWVEAAPNAAELEDAEALGFSNDGVSPVIVGGRDWAGAWAVRPGRMNAASPLLPMPEGGERQREEAMRFGVNLAMYAYTGSYKSDQVHIPMLLERLGR